MHAGLGRAFSSHVPRGKFQVILIDDQKVHGRAAVLVWVEVADVVIVVVAVEVEAEVEAAVEAVLHQRRRTIGFGLLMC